MADPRVGALRKRPSDSNVWERWNGAEWLFYCWADITKASTATHDTPQSAESPRKAERP